MRSCCGVGFGPSLEDALSLSAPRRRNMGRVFRRNRSAQWQVRYRCWDAINKKWGGYKDESSRTRNKREAEALLFEREEREERKRRGLELSSSEMELTAAVTAFLDFTQSFDEVVPERNRTTEHPVLGVRVEGTPWWIRTLDFSSDVVRFFGKGSVDRVGDVDELRRFDVWLRKEGGRRMTGLSQSSRHKVFTWLRRFAGWCVDRGYLPRDPFKGTSAFQIPREVACKKARILSRSEEDAFWLEYEKLALKAKVRVGLIMFTGARSGEVDTLRAADIDPGSNSVCRRIWKGSKGGAFVEQAVRVPEALMEVLLAWIEENRFGPDDLLLPMRCQAGNKFLRRWRTSARGLRRTVLTRLHSANVPLRVIQEAAGHSKLSTTQKYLGVSSGAVSEAISEHVTWGRRSYPSATKSATDLPHQLTTLRVLTRHLEEEEEKKVG